MNLMTLSLNKVLISTLSAYLRASCVHIRVRGQAWAADSSSSSISCPPASTRMCMSG